MDTDLRKNTKHTNEQPKSAPATELEARTGGGGRAGVSKIPLQSLSVPPRFAQIQVQCPPRVRSKICPCRPNPSTIFKRPLQTLPVCVPPRSWTNLPKHPTKSAHPNLSAPPRFGQIPAQFPLIVCTALICPNPRSISTKKPEGLRRSTRAPRLCWGIEARCGARAPGRSEDGLCVVRGGGGVPPHASLL